MREAVIELPYILYIALRKRLYGNTYIFPYIVNSGTLINQASNTQEWINGNGGGIWDWIKSTVSGLSAFVGNFATGAMGSQARAANLFPAPTWKGADSNSSGVQFKFDLILINDHIIKARNNYMCVNTIIHNNRYLQKAILAFPGALYELWLPTGQRHLMCSADFKLYPLGLNRKVPDNFFEGDGSSGAKFRIGADVSQSSG